MNTNAKEPFRLVHIWHGWCYACKNFHLNLMPVAFAPVFLLVLATTEQGWKYAATFLVFFYFAIWIFAIGEFRKASAEAREKFLSDWLASARDDKERARRQSILSSGGTAAALAAAGQDALSGSLSMPVANVDGTPMIAGTNLDMNGNVYGLTPTQSGEWNTDTGQFIAENNSYMPPMGMDDRS